MKPLDKPPPVPEGDDSATVSKGPTPVVAVVDLEDTEDLDEDDAGDDDDA
jgi:hypothetical protein